MADNQNLGCSQGDSYSFNIIIGRNPDGSRPNLSNAQITWSLFDGDYPGAAQLVQKTGTLGEVQVGGVTTDVLAINLVPTDTATLPPGSLYHECKIILGDGRTKHPESGRFVVKHSGNP